MAHQTQLYSSKMLGSGEIASAMAEETLADGGKRQVVRTWAMVIGICAAARHLVL